MYNVSLQRVSLNNKKKYYTLRLQFFLEFHTWVYFSLEGETIFEGDMRRGGEEVFTYALFLCVVALSEDRHKNGCEGDQRGRSNAWWLSTLPRLPLPHSPWKCLFSRQTYWILLTRTVAHEHKMICGYQTMFDAFQVCGHLQVGSCKLPFIQVEIVVVKNT